MAATRKQGDAQRPVALGACEQAMKNAAHSALPHYHLSTSLFLRSATRGARLLRWRQQRGDNFIWLRTYRAAVTPRNTFLPRWTHVAAQT